MEKYDNQVDINHGGCTSVLQPWDVGINKSLKSIIKRNFEDWKIARQDLPPSNLFALEWKSYLYWKVKVRLYKGSRKRRPY